MKSKQIQWLLKNAAYLRIYSIEKELGMYEGCLKKFIDCKRALPKKWESKIITWVNSHTSYN